MRNEAMDGPGALITHAAPRTPHPARRTVLRRGQALLELAIFGSFILMVLGILVNYALQADFNQQATMQTFRQALASAAVSPNDNTPSSVSQLTVLDRYSPDPAHPFAVGGAIPVAASSAVTRNHTLQKTADTEEELPRIKVWVQGEEVDCPSPGTGCTTAGFRTVRGVTGTILSDGKWVNKTEKDAVGTIDKHEEIFGGGNWKAVACHSEYQIPFVGEGEAPPPESPTESPAEPPPPPPPGAFPGPPGETQCLDLEIKLIDPCHGEVLSFDACMRQVRQIVDPNVCAEFCEKSRRADSNDLPPCSTICAIPIERPWYAQEYVDKNGRTRYLLDDLFKGVRALGLQPDQDRTTTLDTTITKTESAGSVTTSSLLNWRDQVTRKVVYRSAAGPPAEIEVERTPKDAQGATTSWTTPWGN